MGPRVTANRALALKLLLLYALGQVWSPTSWPQQSNVPPRAGPAAHPSLRRLLGEAAPKPEMVASTRVKFLHDNSTANGGGGAQIPGFAALGVQLVAAADNVRPSIADCVAACRAIQRCNVVWYCEEEGGCSAPGYNLSSPHHGCQLLDQEETKPGTGRPVLLVPAANFTAGAPLRYAPVPVEGYDAHPGLGFWYRYDLPCSDTVSQPGSCGLPGGPQESAARCNEDTACQVMMSFPDGRDYPGAGQPVVLLKGSLEVALDLADAILNTNAVLYKKRAAPATSSGGSGLSTGAIVGIVVGTCCGVGLAATASILIVRRRRRQRAAEEHSGLGGVATFKPAASNMSSKTSSVVLNGSGSGLVLNGFALSGSANGSGVLVNVSGGHSAMLAISNASSSVVMLNSSGHASIVPHSAGHSQNYALDAQPLAVLIVDETQQPRAIPWAEATDPVSSAALPCGDPNNSVIAKRPAKAKDAKCTATPPPSAGNSMVSGPGLPPLRPAARSSSPHEEQMLGVPAGTTPTAVARAGTPPSSGPHSLLSHLPTYGWQRSTVEYSSIEFVRNPDGSLQELGVGASATVYRVLLNGVEPHAAKVFRLGCDAEAQLYFVEEASTLRLLRHKHIVGFAGVCVADGNGIILMELMEGGDLRRRNRELDAQGRRMFDWYLRGRRVALDVALALNYLHSSSYTHFDVKSRNVLLSRDGTAKLADVGFARAIRATHHSITGPMGTFDYMAPELLNGRKCNSSIDVYSFGCLLWEIVVGTYPARGAMREPNVPEECPQEVADLIQECMQEEAAARPSARQLVERLTALQ